MNIVSTACKKILQKAATTNSQLLYNSLEATLETPVQCCVMQVRNRKGHRRKNRHTVQPFWQAQVTRTQTPEHITTENEEFISEVVAESYSSPLALEPWPRGEWDAKSQRCGVIGVKLGCYPMWRKDGTSLLTTILHISDNHVVKHIPYEELAKNEYFDRSRQAKKKRGKLIVGADSKDPRTFTKEYCNMFLACGVMPKRKLTSFLVTDNAVLQPGTPLFASHFRPGDHVDISGYTIDRGFQGVMVRWGMHGMGKGGHGQTKTHRRPGCIGYGKDRVLAGKKLPGHMGNQFRTAKGAKVVRVNSKYNCIWINGMLHGSVGDYFNIYDSGLFHRRHRDPDNHPPFPTHYPDEDPLEEDWHDENLFDMSHQTIEFAEDDDQMVAK